MAVRSAFEMLNMGMAKRRAFFQSLKAPSRFGSSLATKPVEPDSSSLSTTATPPLSPQLSSYRRELPSFLLPFNSAEGKALFKESLLAGYAESYFNLVGNFTTQSEPTYCGLGSLAMVLNALEVDPGRNWKGVWRWQVGSCIARKHMLNALAFRYSDEMIECCAPLSSIREKGITFHEFSCLATCNGLHTIAKRWDMGSLEEFEADLHRTSTSISSQLVVSFSRQALSQTGIGHFSPIGAIHPTKRLALVLDVARFKYPSYWVSIDMLWHAMKPLDPDTNLPRGYFLLARKTKAASTLVKLKEDYQWPPTRQAAEAASQAELVFVESEDPMTQQELVELKEEIKKLSALVSTHVFEQSGRESESDRHVMLNALSQLIMQPTALRLPSLSPLLASQIERISQQLYSYKVNNRYCTCQQKTGQAVH